MSEIFGNNLVLMFLLALWTLPWKGVALWRAAQREEKKWFIAILVLNTLAVLEIIYIFVITKKSPKKKSTGQLAKARAAIQRNKKEAKEKIIETLPQKGRITNDEVQALLGVSDATATRYMEELEKDGEVIQKGNRGSKVFYVQKMS